MVRVHLLKIVFSTAVALLLSCPAAWADYVRYYVDVDCQPSLPNVSIKLGRLQSTEPTFDWHGRIRPADAAAEAQHFRVSSFIDYGECDLAVGKRVRVKISEGRAMPYGMCGADPEIWLSVWVDRRKWLSRLQIAGRCLETIVSRVDVAPDGMTICRTALGYVDGEEVAGAEDCRFEADSTLAREPDLKEYPVGPRGPEPGSIVIAHAEDEKLCRSMVVPKTTAFKRQNWQIELPPDSAELIAADRAHGLYDSSGHFSRHQFDIDNSGKARSVYGFHPSHHANDADMYFLSPGATLDMTWPELSIKLLYELSPYIFPYSFGRCRDHACGPDDDHEEGTITLRHYQEDNQPFVLRFRYLHEVPFGWHGTTYFLVSTLDQSQRHVTAVLKPQPTAFEETCIFSKVRENY